MLNKIHARSIGAFQLSKASESTPFQRMPERRSPVVQEKQQQGLKVSLVQAENYGHHLDRVQPAINSTGTPIQAKFGFGRSGKKPPKKLYRLDERRPEQIQNSGGFTPHNPNGKITLNEHVSGKLNTPDQNGGNLAKPHSQYVSTGKIGMLQDQKILTMVPNKTLYKIKPSGQNYHSVKDHYKKIGQPQPYPQQKEWAKEGNISPGEITHYMPEQQLLSQLPLKRNPWKFWRKPRLKGWQDMPSTGGTN